MNEFYAYPFLALLFVGIFCREVIAPKRSQDILKVEDVFTKQPELNRYCRKGDTNQKETPDLIIGKAKYTAELIPPALIVERFFKLEMETGA